MRKQFLIGLAFAVMAAAAVSMGYAAEPDYAPQVSNEGGVKVTVTPRISSTAKAWDFQVVMETHARDLGEDLAKVSVLIADGRQYLPVGWEGAPPGGHHRKGKLRFKAIAPQPKSMELQIRLAGDASPRSFKWPVK